jgi:hypothetical protein
MFFATSIGPNSPLIMEDILIEKEGPEKKDSG